MANVKITRKDALSAAITFMNDNGYDNEDVMNVLNNMLNKLSTTSKRSGETAAHKKNAILLQDNIHLFDNENVLTARMFANDANNFPVDTNGRPSVHKATAVLVQGVNDGFLVKVPSEKKSAPMQYKLA